MNRQPMMEMQRSRLGRFIGILMGALLLFHASPQKAGKTLVEEIQDSFSVRGIPLPAEDSTPSEADSSIVQFLKGVYFVERGEAKSALLFLSKARQDSSFPLPDYLLYYTAKAYAAQEDYEGARPLLMKLLEGPSGIFTPKAYQILIEMNLSEKDVEAAKKNLLALLSGPGKPEDKARGCFTLLSYLLEQGDFSTAYSFANEEMKAAFPPITWRRAPFRDAVRLKWQAYLKLTEKEQSAFRVPMFNLLKGVGLMDEGEQLLLSAPDSYWKHMELAQILYSQQRYEEAKRHLQKALKKAKTEEQKADVNSLLAKTYARLNETEEALQSLDALSRHREAEALFRKADYLASLGQVEKALPLFEKILTAFPQTAYVEPTRFWLFQYYLKQGKEEEAIHTLQSIETIQDPDYAPFIHYWRNKIAHEGEAGKLLLKNHPYSFYALRLLQESGGSAEDFIQSFLGRARAGETEGQEENGLENPPLDSKYSLLHDWGLYTWLFEELIQASEGESPSPEAMFRLARAYAYQGDYYDSVQLADKLIQSRLEGEFREEELKEIFRLAFPLAYYDIVQKECANYGLDPLLILALIRQESRFDPRAYSISAARGLMQIIQPTGKALAQVAGIPFRSPEILYDPETNIKLGVLYFQRLLKAFDNNLIFAIAAYNWGPNAVQKWMSSLPADALADEMTLIELISSKQARLYVKKVLFNYWIYTSLMKKGVYGEVGAQPTPDPAPVVPEFPLF